eukprot:GHVS01087522.1.p2 GENE.GHVS01087522.1~~GHVS01087522.1.p2  ORF type:complete len:101 (+),score=17.52 GHVS01087522.1:34-336(+)
MLYVDEAPLWWCCWWCAVVMVLPRCNTAIFRVIATLEVGEMTAHVVVDVEESTSCSSVAAVSKLSCENCTAEILQFSGSIVDKHVGDLNRKQENEYSKHI